MNRQLLLYTAFLVGLFTFAGKVTAQNICLVTANFGGQDYVVYWEPFTDYTGLDSVLIYKKQGAELTFQQTGAVKIGPTESTYFTDVNSNTILTTKYAIAIRDSSGNIGPLSPWHQGIIMDYTGNGGFSWTAYQKEDQVDESYIGGYECFLDMSGTGAYTSLGSFDNTQLSWVDANYQSHTIGYYVIIADLPSCEYQTKANINTSRSNIKQQISNAQAGVEDQVLNAVQFEIAPNPVSTQLTLRFGEQQHQVQLWISDASGAVIKKDVVSGSEWSTEIRELPAGVYFVNVKQAGVVSTKRFVKQ